jgi:hypothetical protein
MDHPDFPMITPTVQKLVGDPTPRGLVRGRVLDAWDGTCHTLAVMDERRFVRSEQVVFREVAGETILVPLCADVGDLGSVYVLNPVGAAVWQGLAGPSSCGELARQLTGVFDTTEAAAREDVQDFLQALLVEKLVVCVEGPSP